MRKLVALFLALSAGATAVPAGAALTPINALGAGTGDERCLAGGACPAGGSHAGSNSLIQAFEQDLGLGAFTRIDDAFDNVWTATSTQPVLIRPRARYAPDMTVAGIDAGAGNSPVTPPLFMNGLSVSSPGAFAADPQAADFTQLPAIPVWGAVFAPQGTNFAFTLVTLATTITITSNPSLAGYANSGQSLLDYMVTYRVNDSVPHYFIAWETGNPAGGSLLDGDYNDLVLEVMYAQPAGSPPIVTHVPEHGTLLLSALGLLGVVAAARRAQPDGAA